MVTDVSGVSPIYVRNLKDLQTAFKENKKLFSDNSKEDDISQNDGANKSGTVNNNDSKSEVKQEAKTDYKTLGAKLSNLLNSEDVILEFNTDSKTKKMVLRLIDSKTQEVIEQYPPEESLKIARIVSSFSEGGEIANAKV